MTDADKLEILWEERLIVRVLMTFAHTLDTADWHGHAACFTDPVTIDFSRITGADEVRVGAALWARFAEVILSGMPCHHLLSNFKIDLDGDRAFAVVDMISSLWTPTEQGVSANRQYGWYEFSLDRQGGEWKIARMKHEFHGVEGNAARVEQQHPEFAHVAQQVFSPANIEAAKAYRAEQSRR